MHPPGRNSEEVPESVPPLGRSGRERFDVLADGTRGGRQQRILPLKLRFFPGRGELEEAHELVSSRGQLFLCQINHLLVVLTI